MAKNRRFRHGIRAALGVPPRLFFDGLLSAFLRRQSLPDDALVVFDLDNTLAHTWPSFQQAHPHIWARLAGLPPKPAMIELFKRVRRRRPWLVMTAREYRTWPTTLRWLREHAGVDEAGRVLMVRSAADKLPLLNALRMAYGQVVLIDDMSRNHEHGEMLLYENVINRLARIGITHLGVDFIEGVSHATMGQAEQAVEAACQGQPAHLVDPGPPAAGRGTGSPGGN